MIKVVLACSAGMSTSLLVNKIKDAAKKRNIDLDIKAVAEATVNSDTFKNIDVLLLGPQVRFLLDSMKEKATGTSTPVEIIDQQTYAFMDGEAVLDMILNLVKK